MNDIEICRNTTMLPIKEIGSKINIDENDLELYGKYKAKINLKKGTKNGKLILVTAINPSPYGEGKTTITIGLGDALNKLNYQTIIALREPSLGPVFGVKGCANGGGYAQVLPMEDINLHFTGDLDAITAANNLLCAAVDNHIEKGNELNIDVNKIMVHRCLDVNDRALREIEINGRKDYFTITAASEVMAIFCLAKDITDLKDRLGNILVGYNCNDKAIYAKELHIEGAMTSLLKDAILPNLVQTLENNPAIIHGGPFANIAHGCSSVIGTNLSLSLADYVVTEAGFGSDLGAEKFFDIKCPTANIKPDAVVLVVTTKALKYQAGIEKKNILEENIEAMKKGLNNLQKHIENLKKYNINIIVALNKYNTDTENEINLIKEICQNNLVDFEICEAYSRGSEGAIALAQKVQQLCNKENKFTTLYNLNETIKDKINIICKEIYRSNNIIYSEEIINKLNKLDDLGVSNYPICIAKSQYKLSLDPVIINDIKVMNGAKMIVVLLNNVMTMPGLPKNPNYEYINIDENNNIVGLS